MRGVGQRQRIVEEMAKAIAPYAWDRNPPHLTLMQAGKWRDKAQANARASAEAALAVVQREFEALMRDMDDGSQEHWKADEIRQTVFQNSTR